MTGTRDWYANPAARTWRRGWPTAPARQFHASFPGYRPSALRDVVPLAAELGVGRAFVKDESERLGLPAFKILGASWAVARLLAPQLDAPTLETLRDAAPASLELVTATDGNHGRAIAHMAALLGIDARVFMPAVIPDEAAEAIVAAGAELERIDSDYDGAVGRAAAYASANSDRRLVQDTAWPGYEDVPRWIVEGYRTIPLEIDEQLAALGISAPDLVVVPVGVGSLLQAVIGHYRSGTSGPAIMSVEPDRAACLLASLHAGEPTTVETDATVMAGLNCGTISSAVWPYARDGLDAAVAVSDADALRAIADLAALGISSGPSGAASLAGARAALTGARRGEVGIGPDSTVVLLSTEASVSVADSDCR